MSNSISLPIYYTVEYKTKEPKTFLVSLNWFRNAYHHEQNTVKRYYHDLIKHSIVTAPISSTYKLDIKVFYKNPQSDGSNIAAMFEKFFLDALQELKIVQQDNVKYHLGTTWSVGGQDKDNPRCEIIVIPI